MDADLNQKFGEFVNQRTDLGELSQSSNNFSKKDRAYGIQRIISMAD